MNRIWINYNLWEDYKCGLYENTKQDELIPKIETMFKTSKFREVATKLLTEWPNSIDQNLSYTKSNRQSYLGQAAACYLFGANIKTTIKAWHNLTDSEKNIANKTADDIIKIYDKTIYPKKIKEVLDEEIS